MMMNALTNALRSIWTKKVRSFLTMLGVIIGVVQIIVLIGLGQGIKKQISSEVTELGSNLIFVASGKLFDDKGNLQASPSSAGASTLTDADLAEIRTLPEISDSTILSLLAGVVTNGSRSTNAATILAVEPSYFPLFSTADLIAGRLITKEDLKAGKKVIVIDAEPQKALFPDLSPQEVVGKTVRFAKTDFEIVGVMQTPPSTSAFGGSGFSNAIFIPYTTAKAINSNTQILRILLQIKPDYDIPQVVKTVKETMLRRHGVEDFSVLTQDDLLGVVNTILNFITMGIVGLASISLIVGGIGIMNIMLVAVTERTKEIGLRKALGATRSSILLQFLAESGFISLLGGVIGVAIAWLASAIVAGNSQLEIIISFQTVLLATTFSLIVGIAFGILPAIRAARKDAIEALRYE